MKRISGIIALMTLLLVVAGCNKKHEVENKIDDTISKTVESIEPTESLQPSEVSSNEEKEVDLSKYFDGIYGGAVIIDKTKEETLFYQKELCETEYSPFSTFKIIACLIGLDTGVLEDENTLFKWDKSITYPMEMWNHDMTLKEAFQTSCVWYFRKVIDQIGQDRMQMYLDKLGYGNCDITDWEGLRDGVDPSICGFWLASSLKISLKEQVELMKQIFEGSTCFNEEEIEILKKVSYLEHENAVIYGKTGTGKIEFGDGINGWFVCEVEKKGNIYYIAVGLKDKEKAEQVSGGKAKEIALHIIDDYL